MKIPKKKKPAVSPEPSPGFETASNVSPEPPSVPPPPVNLSIPDPSVPPAVRLDRMVEVPVDRLRKAPWNYKDGDEFKAAQLAANLQRNGQLLNLIVRHTPDGLFEVIDGNHRLDAVLLNKWSTVICYDLGEISERQAKRIAIEINETRFPTNLIGIAKVIEDLKAEFSLEDMLSTFPYKREELEAFGEMVRFDWNSPEHRFPNETKDMPDGVQVKLDFLLTEAQAKVINDALVRIVVGLGIEGKYRMSRALELVAADSLNTPIESFQ